MPEFGLLIVKNPGPATEVEIRGLAGWRDDDYLSYLQVHAEAEKERSLGHIADVITVFTEDETDGSTQIELYDLEQAINEGVVPEKEKEEGNG